MEGVQSFEQRSASSNELASGELDLTRNRLILANRRDPSLAWSSPVPDGSGSGSSSSWLCRFRRGWFSRPRKGSTPLPERQHVTVSARDPSPAPPPKLSSSSQLPLPSPPPPRGPLQNVPPQNKSPPKAPKAATATAPTAAKKTDSNQQDRLSAAYAPVDLHRVQQLQKQLQLKHEQQQTSTQQHHHQQPHRDHQSNSPPRPPSTPPADSRPSSPMGFDLGPFASNEWLTSKYTIYNFLPKNLFEQLRRFANFYFLTTAILQIVLPFSPVGPATSLLPLLFVVSTTAIKQAYEDYLRHRLDKETNNRPCQVLRNKRLIKVRAMDIRVGDVVYVRNNEEIPCDMILLASSGNSDRCHITTANLDGETSLKSRTCFNIREQIGTIEMLDDALLVVECERPSATLYEFSGQLRAPKNEHTYELMMGFLNTSLMQGGGRGEVSSSSARRALVARVNNQQQVTYAQAEPALAARVFMRLFRQSKSSLASLRRSSSLAKQKGNVHLAAAAAAAMATESQGAEFHEIPLDLSNLLLRASRLKNTAFVYGLVIYTGQDTKLAQNSHVKPNKFSSTESRVNLFLLIAFFILVLFSLFGSVLYRRPDYWWFGNLARDDSFWKMLISHFLLYNYMVPISLYVTLEFVKFIGAMSVVNDNKMKTTAVQSVLSSTSASELTGAGSLAPAPMLAKTPAEDSLSMAAAMVPKSVTSNRKVSVIEGPKCNSSDLNEELGQVEVLFSDKTGTLTENRMRFTACSAFGQLYRAIESRLYQQPAHLYKGPIPNFVRRMAQTKHNRASLLVSSCTTPTGQAGVQAAKSVSPPRSASPPASASPSPSPGEGRAPPVRAAARYFDHRVAPPIGQLCLIDDVQHQERVVEFFTCLCLCSTITLNENVPLADCLPDKTLNDYDYQSASPDEESLISAAHQCGVTMCKSNDQECFIVVARSAHSRESPEADQPVKGEFKPIVETKNSTTKYIVRQFKRLLVLEFSSVRKRMSVVYKDCDNDCHLMVTKGSEEMLDCIKLNGIRPAEERQINVTLAHFDAFAKSGLRTLLVAWRFLSEDEFEKLSNDMREARLLAQNRDYSIANVYRRAESQMKLIGTTAVEDTLQEGVPETIAALKDAGIKVWLLTGDKVETAVSVAYLCKLLDRSMNLLHLVRQRDAQSCKRLLELYLERLQLPKSVCHNEASTSIKSSRSEKSLKAGLTAWAGAARGGKSGTKDQSLDAVRRTGPKFALIADGRSFHYAMKYACRELSQVCQRCTCVLGCRLSPIQKAEVVSMMKKNTDREYVTAAIGDGANDVSMIQEAHVGIGVSGKEGRQAVNSSDFAISRFYMLNRLLFVHGNLFYHRTANTIHYFFYKNLLFILPQFLFAFYNLSSAQSLYHPLALICYNMVFTSLPILVYGLSEMHIPERFLEDYPRLYMINRRNKLMRLRVFFSWLLLAAVQAILAFYWLLFNWGSHTPFLESGKMTGLYGFSTILFFVIVFAATMRLYFLARHHSIWFHLSIFFSWTLLPLTFYGYSLLDWSSFINDNSYYGVLKVFLESFMFWVSIWTTLMIAILPDILWLLLDTVDFYRTISRVISGRKSRRRRRRRETGR